MAIEVRQPQTQSIAASNHNPIVPCPYTTGTVGSNLGNDFAFLEAPNQDFIGRCQKDTSAGAMHACMFDLGVDLPELALIDQFD